ncbi:MAG: hypothetical protein FJ104_07045, partial [Deltaproteobacteria bacterium]|nr:hypothetical protein [Deltaproteobacteria bacterium]
PARGLAGPTFRGLIEIHGDESDVEAYQRYLHAAGASADVVDELRWLCRYRAEHDADPRRALDEWVDLEEHRAHDTGAAASVLERVLEATPADERALDRLVLLRTARGEASVLAGLLGRIAEQLDAERRGRVALRLARLFAGPLGRSIDAVVALREVLSRTPDDADALALLSATLPDVTARPEALELIDAVVAALDRSVAASFLERLLAETTGDGTLGAERARWAAQLIERLDDDPKRALEVAVSAAAEAPEDRAIWELAERLARRAGDPSPVFATYLRALDDARTPERAESIGRRYVDFHEEWAEDAETVLPLLERVLSASPRARWALDRIKLAYNAEGRWQELFALYDRAVDAAADDAERLDVLDEAAVAAKDLANDAERAVAYLERRLALARDPRGQAMLERLYERTGRAAELLGMLERRLEGGDAKDALKLETRIARLKLDLGDVGGAFDRVERVLRSSPNERAAYALLEVLVRAPRRPSVPPQGGPKKGKRKKTGRDVREESLKLLEQRYRATGDRDGLVRVIEVVLELEPDRADGRARLEELVDLAEELGDGERAFTHLSSLVALAPADLSFRRRLGDVAARLGAPERRIELLARVASAPGAVALRRDLLRELAEAALEAGDTGRAADALLEVLSLAGDDPAGILQIARRVEPLLGQLDRQEEQCDALECIARYESDPRTRGEVLARAAELAFSVLGDVDRSARAHRARLSDSPRDLDALAGLEGIYAAAERWRDLAEVLSSRAALLGGESARDDRVRVARLLSTRIGDVRGAIDAWRSIVRDFGPAGDAFDALCELLAHEGRHAELGELLAAEAELRPPGQPRHALLLRLADLRRERLGDPAGAVKALFSAGEVDRAIDVVEGTSGRAASRAAAAALLDLAAAEWTASPSGAAPELARAVLAGVDALVLRHQDDGEHREIVALRLRVAELPFDPPERRRLRRDAAWVAADQLGDAATARRILAELFAEDPADDVAAAAVARYARLLGEADEHGALAGFWEEQARVRTEGGDRVAAAALLARAAEIHEAKLGDVGAALADHRAGAALGGEASLEAIARIELARRRPRAAVDALEWLVAGS